ncbi:MAG TPA: methyl-accepting chemotaxis protein [Gemmatimonadales bacterium]|nr:methyl-accepting chemotaxis protein [Gemmatimonadales bacterium]
MTRVRSLRALVAGGLVLLLGLMLANALLSANSIRSLGQEVELELRRIQQGAELEAGLVSSVFSAMRAADRYLLAPDPALRAELIASGDAAYAHQRRFRDLGGLTTEDLYLVNRLATLQAEIEVSYGMAHALADLGRTQEARAQAAAVKPLADTLVAGVRALTQILGRRALERSERLRETADDRLALILVLVFAALGTGVAATFYILRSINRPLRELVAAADRFGAGDLRPVQLGVMPAELAHLGRALTDMGTRLRALVTAVVAEARKISNSAGDFSAMSQELASSSGEISTAMVRIARSAETQMTGMQQADALLQGLQQAVTATTEAAARVARLGDEIRAVAERHRGDVDAAGRTLLDVREVVHTSAQQVGQLAELSVAITDFIDLIKQISSQTNLLALNAAIEAARAGEHGRGFAVVAEEVRKLADSSARAAEDVARTVERIRGGVREVVETMEVGMTKVRGIEGVAQAVVGGLEEIATAVQEIHAAAERVSQEADRNRAAVTELLGKTAAVTQAATEHASSSEEVTAAAEQQSASTEEMASAASDLLEGAVRLERLVAEFKT